MKKTILALILAIALSCAAALPASAGSSGAAYKKILAQLKELDYDDLLELRYVVNELIKQAEGCKEVTVPTGVYKIGEEIPEGHWTIRAAGTANAAIIYYYQKPDESGFFPDAAYPFYINQVATEDLRAYESSLAASIDIDMKNGWYFQCDSAVLFSPYEEQDLGFK